MHVPGLPGSAPPRTRNRGTLQNLGQVVRTKRAPRTFPVPPLDGQAVAKGAVVRTFECLAKGCGKSLLDDLGRRAFGGHSARVTGARFYAGLGIELRRLAVFARCRSDIILHYVQDSALSRFTAECVVLLRKDSTEQISSDDHMERVHLSNRIVKIEQAIEQAAVQEQRLTSSIEQLTALGCPKFVRNETSGTWHKTAAADLRLRPADWYTFCGWRFSSVNFQLVEDFPSTSWWSSVVRGASLWCE